MNATQFLFGTLIDLYMMLVLLRLWLQFVQANFYNPLSQFVVKATHPVIAPMRRLFPSVGNLDTATLILALLLAMLKITLLSMLVGVPIQFPGLLFDGALGVLREAFGLVFWTLIIRALLSWISNGNNPIEYVLIELTEPLLAPIRRILPAAGGFDFSILVAIIALQFVQLLLQDILRSI